MHGEKKRLFAQSASGPRVFDGFAAHSQLAVQHHKVHAVRRNIRRTAIDMHGVVADCLGIKHHEVCICTDCHAAFAVKAHHLCGQQCAAPHRVAEVQVGLRANHAEERRERACDLRMPLAGVVGRGVG